jgi:hypothetical protein
VKKGCSSKKKPGARLCDGAMLFGIGGDAPFCHEKPFQTKRRLGLKTVFAGFASFEYLIEFELCIQKITISLAVYGM